MHSLLSAVDVHSNLLDVGIPDSVGSSMRMADVISKMSALAADITFYNICIVSKMKHECKKKINEFSGNYDYEAAIEPFLFTVLRL